MHTVHYKAPFNQFTMIQILMQRSNNLESIKSWGNSGASPAAVLDLFVWLIAAYQSHCQETSLCSSCGGASEFCLMASLECWHGVFPLPRHCWRRRVVCAKMGSFLYFYSFVCIFFCVCVCESHSGPQWGSSWLLVCSKLLCTAVQKVLWNFNAQK